MQGTDTGPKNLLGHSLPCYCRVPQFRQLGKARMMGPILSGAGFSQAGPDTAITPLFHGPREPSRRLTIRMPIASRPPASWVEPTLSLPLSSSPCPQDSH